jgi:cobalt-zinc-cadmium efflux system protein
MEAVEGVVNVHDLHVWSLGSQSRALACHVTIADIPPSESACISLKLNGLLREQYSRSATPPSSSSTLAAKLLDGCVAPPESISSGHAHPHHHPH